jgi:hypothetical protein
MAAYKNALARAGNGSEAELAALRAAASVRRLMELQRDVNRLSALNLVLSIANRTAILSRFRPIIADDEFNQPDAQWDAARLAVDRFLAADKSPELLRYLELRKLWISAVRGPGPSAQLRAWWTLKLRDLCYPFRCPDDPNLERYCPANSPYGLR